MKESSPSMILRSSRAPRCDIACITGFGDQRNNQYR
jgi:hypothetical protein